MDIERVKRRLRRCYQRNLAECEQAIRDAAYWNQINPHETPMDVEWFRVQADGLRKCLKAVDDCGPIKDEWLQKE